MGAGRPQGSARPPGPSTPPDHVDPTIGCFNGCGENRPQMLRIYQLVYRGRPVGHWRLCAECFVWGNPPPDPDPLDVTAA
jgi:hypothetical protein